MLINGDEEGRLAEGEEDTADACSGISGPLPATIGILALGRLERDLALELVAVHFPARMLPRLGKDTDGDDDEGGFGVKSLSLFFTFCSCSSEDGCCWSCEIQIDNNNSNALHTGLVGLNVW